MNFNNKGMAAIESVIVIPLMAMISISVLYYSSQFVSLSYSQVLAIQKLYCQHRSSAENSCLYTVKKSHGFSYTNKQILTLPKNQYQRVIL